MTIEAQISGRFTGWSGGTLFRLTNGQFWVQTRYAYHYHYAYRPRVRIETNGSHGILEVEGVRSSIEVRRTTATVGRVKGAFRGWQGQTVVELANGQQWKQKRYHYEYRYSYSPEAIVYQQAGEYLMSVDGMRPIGVQRVR